jgi:hypothetical protein
MARPPLHGCSFLLLALILLLMLFPMLEDLASPILLISAVAAVFVAGVIVVAPGRGHIRSAVILAAVQIALTGASVGLAEESFWYLVGVSLALAATVVLIAYCIYCVLRYVLQAYAITHDQIYAGICVYLMLGFAFGSTYYLISILSPGCFVANNTRIAAGGAPDLMYFSFVTLATLGYGDITPVTKIARFLAELEALAGMLYIAIFMARLVTMYSAPGGDPDLPAGRGL